MKKLAVLGSGNGSNFEAIAKWLNGKDVEITCLCDNKEAFILKRAENLGVKSHFLPFEENLNYFKENKFDLIALAGYMRILPKEVLENMGTVLNIHPSILPAFKGANAIHNAFVSGVKVSGVTIHFVTEEVDSGKIISQFPVFINNDTHFDEFEEQIHTIEHKLYPIVIEKILENKVFDFADLIQNNQGLGSGCGGCHSSGGCGSKGDSCGGCSK